MFPRSVMKFLEITLPRLFTKNGDLPMRQELFHELAKREGKAGEEIWMMIRKSPKEYVTKNDVVFPGRKAL